MSGKYQDGGRLCYMRYPSNRIMTDGRYYRTSVSCITSALVLVIFFGLLVWFAFGGL